MKTNNIFRMLLVAAVLLLGANIVKADVTGQIWPEKGGNGNSASISIGNQIFIDRNISENDVIRVYCGEITGGGGSFNIRFWANSSNPEFSEGFEALWETQVVTNNQGLINNSYINLKCSSNTAAKLKAGGFSAVCSGITITNIAILVADSRTPVTLNFSNTWKDITVGDNGVDGLGLTTDPSGLNITYESNNERIATVGTDGKVTGVAPGIATITATFEGNTTYKPDSKSYYLVVKHAFSGTAEGTQLWSGSIYFGDWQTTYGSHVTITNMIASSIQKGDNLRCYGAVETLGVDQGGAQWQLQLCASNNWSEICIKNHYTQSDDNSIRNNGYIDIEVTDDIYNKIQNGFYIQGHNLTLFRVTRIEKTVTKPDVYLNFGETSAVATVGTNFTKTATATSNGQNITVAISYSSSNQSVATVNSSTGEVTPLTEGTTTITASFGGDNNYNAASSVSYTLTVNAAPQTPEYIIVNMGSYECRTYVTTTNIDFSQSVGIKGYYATGLTSDGTAVQFTRVTGVVPASVPLLLQKISGAFEYKLRMTDVQGTEPSPNKLVAGTGSASSSGNRISGSGKYVLTVHNGQLVFAETSNQSAQVTGEHAYLDISTSNARGHLIMSFDDNDEGVTGINAIESGRENSEVIYDLRGQRVQNLKKGIYIVNGKKMVIK
jgi:uncharacterized protein YjdB